MSFRLFPRNIIHYIFQKIKKKLSWGHFGHWAKMIFWGKKALSFVRYSNYLTSCKNLEKTDPFLRKMSNDQIDKKTDRSDRQKNGETDRHITMIS